MDKEVKSLTRAEALANLQAANEEFQALFSDSKADSEVDADDVDSWSDRDKIIAAAWEAYYSHDDTAAIEAIEAAGLSDAIDAIAEKYDVEASQKALKKDVSRGSGGTSYYQSTRCITGDFFLKHDTSLGGSGSWIGWIIPGVWKHAGLYVETVAEFKGYHIFSGSNNTTSAIPSNYPGSVGFEDKYYWTSDEDTTVQVRRVSANNGTNGKAAYNYIKKYEGYPMHFVGFGIGKLKDGIWYCSKLVWRAWYSQGINLEPSDRDGDIWVTPTDLSLDSDAYYLLGDSE